MRLIILSLQGFFLWLTMCQACRADHLVGGYIRMTQVDQAAGKFKLTFVFYVDVLRVDPTIAQKLANYGTYLKIYRQKDHALMREIPLYKDTGPLIEKEVIYDNKSCAELRQLKTKAYSIEGVITLNLNDYTDPGGYYIGWKDCCRNYALSNVISPGTTGVVITHDFPALVQNGKPIKYSAPEIPILNGDYICINKPFTYDFSALDPDGDELRYSLVKPYAGNNSTLDAQPGPYATVNFTPGITTQSMIPGNPALQINSKTGVLSVKASQIGLFVFAVQIEKYRNGVRLGASRHEFQLPVVDCSLQTPPPPLITLNGVPIKEAEVCQGSTITLETVANPDWAFQWQKDGDNIEKATTNTLLINKPGKYAVVKSLLRTCANDTLSGIVTVKEKPLSGTVKILANKTVFCPADSVVLTAQSTTNTVYEWFENTALIGKSATITVKKAGKYHLQGRTTSDACPSLPDSIQLSFFLLPTLPAQGSAQKLCVGDTIALATTENFSWKYQWKYEQKDIGQKAAIMVKDTGIYVVSVTDINGCETTSLPYVVEFRDECKPVKLFIPEIFTPNEDGINDVWEIKNIQLVPNCIVTIFNRWGEVVYHSEGYQNPWDGKYKEERVEKGSYAYIVHLPSQSFTYRGRVVVGY